jgi:spoIIIJ-associated protein
MPLDKKMEFEGKDVADAISKACKALKVSQENLDIEVLTTGTSGIFGLCRQKTRLRVVVKKEYREKTAKKTQKRQAKQKSEKVETFDKRKKPSSEEKKKEVKPKPAVKILDIAEEPGKDTQLGTELLAKVEADLSRILELMDFPSDVSVSSSNENVNVLIAGKFVNDIIAENGKVLDSLEYLLRKMIGKIFTEKAIISLDAGDFRANRNEGLKKLGLELAADVKKSGKTRSSPSLNPSERRVVHIALQDDKDIRSRSVGEGLFKKILIYPPGRGKKRPARRKRGGNKNKKQ